MNKFTIERQTYKLNKFHVINGISKKLLMELENEDCIFCTMKELSEIYDYKYFTEEKCPKDFNEELFNLIRFMRKNKINSFLTKYSFLKQIA